MKYAYPVKVQRQPDGYYLAEAPDLPGVVCGGESLPEVLQNVAAGCEMWLADAEANGESIPEASAVEDMRIAAGEFPSVVVADTDEYRRKNDARAVKKTVSIPAWMADRAERAGVSLSQTLQDALRKQFAAP